jgi:hypothetical protein
MRWPSGTTRTNEFLELRFNELARELDAKEFANSEHGHCEINCPAPGDP